MKFEVYHADNPTFGFGQAPRFPEEYTKVATVDAEGLEDTFRITNHIDHAWETNPEVVELHKDRNRSTSVGDVVVDPYGDTYLCAGCGWELIEKKS